MTLVKKKDSNKEASDDLSKEAKSFIEALLGDVSKSSALKQIALGTTSGWVTGRILVSVGKVAALAVGGGILILQVAAHEGYIHINWDKVQRKAEKISDKVEEQVTGEGPKFLDKVERYVDKKLDKAEKLIKNGESRSKRWFQSMTGDKSFRFKEIHFFVTSFAAGFAIGLIAFK